MIMERLQTGSSDEGDVSAAEVMDRVATELHRLHTQLHQVESMVCAMASGPGLGANYLEELQQFDVMLQTLSALAEFMQSMARETDGASSLPLDRMAAAVKLGDLRLRLSGTGQNRHHYPSTADDGEIGWHEV